MKKLNFFFVFFLFTLCNYGQNLPNDCVNYIQACDNQSVAYNVSGAGIQEIVPPSCSSNENNSLWLRVTIDQPGTLGFDLVPQSTAITEDYDFWVFGPNSTCTNLGTPIRCSTTNPQAAGQANNHTGLNATSTDTNEGPGANGDSYVQQLTVSAGQSYFIVIDRPIGNSPFTLTWTGTATIANPFAAFNFQDFDGVELCDAGNDGVELFDFSTLTANYLAGTSGQFTVTYFSSLQNASINSNPLIGLVNVNSGIYYARISNTLTTCFIIKTVAVSVQEFEVNDLQKTICENTPSQEVIVDLSSYQNELFTGVDLVVFNYFPTLVDATLATNELTNWQSITLPVGTHAFYVKATQGLCVDIAEIQIVVVQRPQLNLNISLKQCDDNLDGFSAFNLTEANVLLSLNPTVLTFNYYHTLTEAETEINSISNPISYVNQNPSVSLIYVRATNSNGCFQIVPLELIVSTTLIPINYIEIFTTCDDELSGSNTDGIATFDFSSFTNSLLNTFPQGQQLVVTYYETLEDALAEINSIQNSSNYTNSGSPFSQEIFVRIDSQLNNSCIGLGHHITLQTESIPIINPFEVRGCDDDNDGFFSFDTPQLITDFLNGLTNVTLEFRDENNLLLSNPLPNPFITTGETIQVFIQNSTSSACSFLTSIAFIVDSKPQSNAIDVSLTTICDEEIDPLVQDGLFAFNTSGFETTILGGQTGVFVEFYDEDNVPLTNPLPNPFITSTQTITAKVINENNPNCFTTVAIPFKVLPTPKIVLQGNDQYVCLDNPSYLITLKAGFVNEIFIASHTYQWYLNQTPIQNATGYSVLINQSGTYTVEVTSVGGCTKTRTIQVIDSQRAIIENIVVNDLIDQNSIEIMVSGLGNYHYSIDGINYQESNVFSNVEPGIVTVFIKDLYNCGIVTAEVNVLAIPKFFTPNADSYNDVWNLKGVNLVYNVHSKIAIFDRYGKLIYQFIPINGGWNGTYNGRPLPSDDYWYLIQLEDGRTAKGHFTLKR
jgi:gliding motility-associated-like protein